MQFNNADMLAIPSGPMEYSQYIPYYFAALGCTVFDVAYIDY